ncbi:hypothetical protein BH10PAT3_BH10PAT3_2930 [soil metagenome]
MLNMSATGKVWQEIASKCNPENAEKCDATRAMHNIEQVIGIFGAGYKKGVDIANRLDEIARSSGEINNFRGPIFSEDPIFDDGTSIGFKVRLGVPPDQPLEAVVDVIRKEYGLYASLVPVASESELHENESFMMGRLPGVRVCIYESTANQV